MSNVDWEGKGPVIGYVCVWVGIGSYRHDMIIYYKSGDRPVAKVRLSQLVGKTESLPSECTARSTHIS